MDLILHLLTTHQHVHYRISTWCTGKESRLHIIIWVPKFQWSLQHLINSCCSEESMHYLSHNHLPLTRQNSCLFFPQPTWWRHNAKLIEYHLDIRYHYYWWMIIPRLFYSSATTDYCNFRRRNLNMAIESLISRNTSPLDFVKNDKKERR